jgi:multicomponent Na+:H+ antiporter subunit E
MTPLFINIALAMIWAAMTGEVTAGNLAVGFMLGYAILVLQQVVVGKSTYYHKVNRTSVFLLYFLMELLLSSLRVAAAALFPRRFTRPGIVAIPLDAKTDIEIVLLASVVTLTPGTLSLEVSGDRSTLFVHCMFLEDPDRIRREIKDGLERRLLEVLR